MVSLCTSLEAAASTGSVFDPQKIMIDFENGAIRSIRETLHLEPLGCLFHFTKCLYGKVKKYGLIKLYANNETFYRQFNRIKVSSLVQLCLKSVSLVANQLVIHFLLC